MDTSPAKRKEMPDFYGYVPPTGRALVFVLMMINSASQFLAKISAIALLGAVSSTWTLAYLAGDLCVYIVYKIARRDFINWIPMQSFVGSLVFGCYATIAQKVRILKGRCARASEGVLYQLSHC